MHWPSRGGRRYSLCSENPGKSQPSREFVARIGRLACGDGWRRRATPSVTLDPHAVQDQCCSPSPYPQTAAPGDKLGRIRCCLAPAREPDGLVHGGGGRGLGGRAAHHAGRPAALVWSLRCQALHDVALLLLREMSCIPVQRPAPITPPHQVMLALDWLRLIVTIGGKLARGRGFSRRNLVSGRSTWDRNHDAAMRIGSEAPRGGPNLLVGIEAMWGNGALPPRIVIGYPSRTLDERPNPFHECAGSDRRT